MYLYKHSASKIGFSPSKCREATLGYIVSNGYNTSNTEKPMYIWVVLFVHSTDCIKQLPGTSIACMCSSFPEYLDY